MEKKHLLCYLSLMAALVAGCKKTDNAPAQIENKTAVQARVCVDKPMIKGNVTTEGVVVKASRWPNKKVITVKFLNGSTFLRSKVKTYAKVWENYASIKFNFVADNQPANLKVSFSNDQQSWSYIGTDALTAAPGNDESIHFGWFDDTTDDSEFSRTVTHEFGHAIGLAHEQSSPAANILWNKPVVYAYYAQFGWSKSDVDYNVFYKYSSQVTQYSKYDPASIMQYPIDKGFTTNGFSVGWNTVLSATDKSFIATIYPKI
ncbi:M12 family metallopeptidase [Chitinophaga sp. 22321]|uniref:Matrixin family metalloprotease n=1 Tax=Chitinophaga hostae TaxID=2831022 RepID=A0ABS5J6P9_9BACT|nr:M12 family metallopeptidase [Chitinophaga hostae]MBS0030733.1 matrixin family metalloprotease [Chitinophaga hostae]